MARTNASRLLETMAADSLTFQSTPTSQKLLFFNPRHCRRRARCEYSCWQCSTPSNVNIPVCRKHLFSTTFPLAFTAF